MTQTLIEQLQALPRFNIFKFGTSAAMVEQGNGKYVNIEDLRAIIEQHKSQPDIVYELVKALEIYSDRLYEHKDIATAASEIGKILGKCYKEYGIQEAKK